MPNAQLETTVANPVKEIRLKLGITQEEMAQELGCSLSSERRHEYDKTTPSTLAVKKNLQRLAKKAGVSLE